MYLVRYDSLQYEVDGFTQVVAEQTHKVIGWFGYESGLEPHESESSVKLMVEQKYVSRIVEGCNAVSVMVLFAAFVIAFRGRLKHTILFIASGVVIIHILNIFRIAAISIALYFYPEHEHLLHGVLFPLFIYGVVFTLWVIWVTKYSLYAGKSVTK